MASKDAPRCIDRAVDDEPEVARHRLAELVRGLIVPPFHFNHAIPILRARCRSRVSEPSCNRLSASVERRAEAQPVMARGCTWRCRCRDAGAAIDGALLTKPRASTLRRMNRAPPRPSLEQAARKIVAAKPGVARCGGSATPPSPPPPGPLPPSRCRCRCRTAGTGAGTAHVGALTSAPFPARV